MAKTERPVLFRDDMVRAILAGRKTVTRRVGPSWVHAAPGDRMWFRETWKWVDGPDDPREGFVGYRADDSARQVTIEKEQIPPPRSGWAPSIFMPRWASRLAGVVLSSTLLHDGWLLAMDDTEAAREGFESADAFRSAWSDMHSGEAARTWRVAFLVDQS